MSAQLCLEGTKTKAKIFEETWSRSHAILTAKCLFLSDTELLRIMETQAWLSSSRVEGAERENPSSNSKPRSQTTSLAASVAATNSVSAVDRHTIVVHLDAQDTKHEPKKDRVTIPGFPTRLICKRRVHVRRNRRLLLGDRESQAVLTRHHITKISFKTVLHDTRCRGEPSWKKMKMKGIVQDAY